MDQIREDKQEGADQDGTKKAWEAAKDETREEPAPADKQDSEIYSLIQEHLVNEDNLKKVYNDYRQHKGLASVDFEKNPSDPVTLQHCMDFLLKCVKERPDG